MSTSFIELDFFRVDGVYYGGDQHWGQTQLMRLGGCSTVTACELAICLAQRVPTLRSLYPYDITHVTKHDFVAMLDVMFTYIRPGLRGLTDVWKYADRFEQYAASRQVTLRMKVLPGTVKTHVAAAFIREAIDAGCPVAYLMLRHRDKAFEELEWHWFTLTGYAPSPSCMSVVGATYGQRFCFDLNHAWNTGFRRKGGLVTASICG